MACGQAHHHKAPNLEEPFPSSSSSSSSSTREQDRLIPITNVIRIMRKVLPSQAKVADDSKEAIQECVSEFISFITSEANERCQREQRKTITAEDLLWAMSKLGFDDYMGPLALYLQRYRELEGDHRGPALWPVEPIVLAPLRESKSSAGAYGGLYYRGAAAGAAMPYQYK